MLPESGKRLRIYIGESDRHAGMPLSEWLVRKAREEELAGATVLRGTEGFGAHSRIHTSKILRLSEDLPMIVEIIDADEPIERFLEIVDGVLDEGLATVEPVEVRFYRGGNDASAD